MQILIDISENVYDDIDEIKQSYTMREIIIKAIENGTVIPKGLEPLITKLIEDAKEGENDS